MNIKILNRLDAAERTVKKNSMNHPDLVLIQYQEETGDFLVREDFCKYDKKGNPIKGIKHKMAVIQKLRDYKVKPDFDGVIWFELFNVPGEYDSGFYIVGADVLADIRKAARKKGLSDSTFVVEGFHCCEGSKPLQSEMEYTFIHDF